MSRLQFRNRCRRRGATLIVVVAFLALGLSLGIAFLYKANSQAEFMQKFRESGQGGRAAGVNTGAIGNNDEAPPQPSDLFNMALGQVIYDVPDDETGFYSALRGHSFARSMYGWNAQQPLGNTQAFSGFGRTHGPVGSDWYSLINYKRDLPGSPNLNPEWESGSFIAKSAPYTYPDENNLFLAAVRSDGYVLCPSYHRPYLLTSPNGQGGTGAGDQLRQLRPRASENTAAFPPMTPNNGLADTVRDFSWGDVENLEGKNIIFGSTPMNARQYDSVWIDLDAPVRKWKGRMYKPLFAFLIVDLDGRVNANVAGNLKGPASTLTSNQGWGPWEVNMDQIVGGSSAPFLNGLTAQRRYQTGGAPTKVYSLVTPDNFPTVVPFGAGVPYLLNDAAAPFYSWIDFDASTVTSGNVPAQLQYPLGQYQSSPAYPGRAANGNTNERSLHPLFYNPYLVPQRRLTGSNTDRAFGPQDAFILNHRINGETPAYYRTSDMGALVNQLSTPTYGLGNPRWLLTPTSNDVQVAALRAWRTPTGAAYQKAATPPTNPPQLASGGPIGSPSPGAAPVGANSDFDANWRSLVAALAPVDLNRKLTDYRDPARIGLPFEDTNNGMSPVNGTVNFARAQADRQALAKDIFERLATATGAWKPQDQPFPSGGDTNALRQLAQMAVNIVDHIDNDDYMTPFQWNAYPGVATVETLWGTELPRLVINEAYAQDRNQGMIPAGQANGWTNNGNTHFEIWAELYNPLTPPGGTDVNLSHGGGAPLTFNGNAVYRMKILRDNTYDPQLRADTNLTGDLNPNPAPRIVSPLSNNANQVVAPSNATTGNGQAPPAVGSNPGFYVVGPAQQVPGSDMVQISYVTNQLDIQTVPDPAGNAQPLDRPPTLLLQRLACPHLPEQTDPTLPNYNVYITVDYMIMPNGSVYDFRVANGNTPDPIVPPAQNTAFSWGRSQPYAAYAGPNGSRLAQQTKNMPPMTEINHSFYRQNTNADNPFEWLVHLDRSLISPIELLCVSAWKPHELTQQFVIGNNPLTPANRNLHLADWGQSGVVANSSAARLYRALGLLDVRNRTLGMAFGGRIPGRTNVNTIWDPQVLQAIADGGSGGNLFNTASVTTAWNNIRNSRTRLLTGGSAVWAPLTPSLNGSGDRRLLPAPSFVTSGDLQFPAGEDSTYSPLGSNFFTNNGQSHPYLRNEMLNKILNNITTRSNTFAIWCTIGYFEVTNPGPYSAANRPLLGAELDLDVGANIRHKFFAIVDRTNLSVMGDPSGRILQGPKPVFLSYEPIPSDPSDLRSVDPDTTSQRTIVVRVPALAAVPNGVGGLYDGSPWTIQRNDILTIDVGLNQEPAQVMAAIYQSGVGGTVTLQLLGPVPLRHSRGCAMLLPDPIPDPITGLRTRQVLLGNPGPQPGFNYRDKRYSGVVRFVTQVK